MNRTLLRSLLALVVVLGAGAAHAQTATFEVRATVLPMCRISAPAAISFTVVDPAAATDATGTLTVRCTKGTFYAVALNEGLNGGRQMKSASGELLDYELYSDSGRNDAWPTTVAVPSTGPTATGTPQDITVYARIPAVNPDPAVAYPTATDYTDTVIATVNY